MEACAWRPGAWGEPADEAEARRVLRRAVELGITLIDTSDAYGPEIAERLIGETLAPYAPGVVIATKGGITRQGPAKTEYVGRAGYLIQCVEMSLRRLRFQRIDLYQLHRIDPRTPLEESLGGAPSHAEQDKSATSASAKSPRLKLKPPKKSSLSSPFKTATRSPIAVTRKLSTTASAVASHSFPWYPNAGGKLLKPDHPAAQELIRIAGFHLVSISQLSLAWLLQRSPVMLPIPGTSKVAHLEENIAAAEIKLLQAEWREVEAAGAASQK